MVPLQKAMEPLQKAMELLQKVMDLPPPKCTSYKEKEAVEKVEARDGAKGEVKETVVKEDEVGKVEAKGEDTEAEREEERVVAGKEDMAAEREAVEKAAMAVERVVVEKEDTGVEREEEKEDTVVVVKAEEKATEVEKPQFTTLLPKPSANLQSSFTKV